VRAAAPKPRRSRFVGTSLLLAIVLLSAAACTEDRSGESATGVTPVGTTVNLCTDQALLACARLTSLAALVPDAPTRADGEPITIGMINQENTPGGSFPELSQAVQAGIAFVNEEMGGIDGRPLRLDVCNTKFSAEGSTACGQHFVQAGVPVVLGGIDVFGNGIDTLDANGVPFVGGIPVSSQSVRNKNSFQWSGGIAGATVAFADYAANVVHAESAAIIYGEFGPISDGASAGKATLEKFGVDRVQMVPHPVVSTDLSSPVQVAASSNPDVIFMLEADTGCKGAYDAVHNAGVTATVFYVGACAAPAIVAQAGPEKTEGAIYNVEGPIDPDHPDVDAALYMKVVDQYGDGLDPIGAGTVSFRSFMNLYSILRGLGEDDINPASITRALSSQVDTPSFMGHPYTCDGEQFPGQPALCSPQQILVEMRDGQLHQLGTWIDVGHAFEG
jgi:branched-chain amino acid transport system substrate-binding protein